MRMVQQCLSPGCGRRRRRDRPRAMAPAPPAHRYASTHRRAASAARCAGAYAGLHSWLRFWPTHNTRSSKLGLNGRELALTDLAGAYRMAENTINLRGLKCPLPALRARKLLAGLAKGDIIVIECTDPLTSIDIPNLLRETGDTLESSERNDDVLIFRIRKA